jgi:hypothetical protein
MMDLNSLMVFAKVVDAGRKTKSQQTAERKDVIGEACGVV